MSETDIKERLGAYLDGEVDAEERGRIEAELRRSPDLRDELERLRRTSGQLHRHFERLSSAAVDDRGESLAVERIVRMSTQELRRADVLPPRKRSPLMVLAVLVTLLGGGLLVLLPYLNHEPTAEELVAKAADQVAGDMLELDLGLGGLAGSLMQLAPAGFPIQDLSRARVRIGPDGLSHLRLGWDEESRRPLVQAGHDEISFWIQTAPDQAVRRVHDLAASEGGAALAPILGLGARVRAALAEAKANPRALDLVGRVEDGLQRELWKVRMGGSQSRSSAGFWFNDEGRLERVDFGPIVCTVNHEVRLSRDDFRLDRILPGVQVEELPR